MQFRFLKLVNTTESNNSAEIRENMDRGKQKSRTERFKRRHKSARKTAPSQITLNYEEAFM